MNRRERRAERQRVRRVLREAALCPDMAEDL
jgi:hypothetical protein